MSATDPPGMQAFPAELDTRERRLDPFDWYREMRERSPVRYDSARRCWDVFRYEDVTRVLDDDETFSADPTTAAAVPESDGAGAGMMAETMISVDPPRHDELRAVVEEQFRPRSVADLEPRIRALARQLLDEAIREGGGQLDVVADLAYPLPVTVVAELLGVPPEDRDRFKAWSDAVIATAGDDGEAGCAGPQAEMASYFRELIADRRESPRDDLLSTLAAADADDGTRFSEREVLGTCMLLLVAGNVTTTNLIANAVRCFTDAGILGDLDDVRSMRSAVEEVLRFRSPVQAVSRVATRDVTLGGASLSAGDRVLVWLGSANRDGRRFDDPDSFVPDRSPNQHLAFGHGTHYCLGAPLGRLEAEVALSELVARFDGIERVGGDLTPVESAFVYGVESLPVSYDGAG